MSIRHSPSSRMSMRQQSPNKSPRRRVNRSVTPGARSSFLSNASTGSQRPSNFPQPVRPKSRIDSFHKSLISSGTPSPHDYSPNHSFVQKGSGSTTRTYSKSLAQGKGMGHSRRFSQQKYQTPSPLDYQRVETWGARSVSPSRASSPSMSRSRRSSVGRSRTPGPSSSLRSSRTSGSPSVVNRTFGFSKRFSQDASQSSSPSVGQYNVGESWSRTTQREARPVFGTSRRNPPKRDTSPDPAKYSPQMHLTPLPKRPRTSFSPSKGRGRRSPSPRRRSVSRGSTTPNRSPSPNRRRLSTAQTARTGVHSSGSRRSSSFAPRPNSPYHETRKYSLSNSPQSRHRSEPAYSFGYTPKLKSRPSETPSPNHYNSHEARDRVLKNNSSGAWGKAKRNLHDKISETPSPLHYNTEKGHQMKGCKSTGAVFGKHQRQVSNYNSLSKGPGAYQNYDSPHNSRWKRAGSAPFGRAVREVHRKPKQQTPSAFDYSPQYSSFSKRSAILYFTG